MKKINSRFKSVIKKNWHIYLVFLLLLSFGLRLLEFASSIKKDISPDESWHLTVINLYNNTNLFLSNSPENSYLGDIATTPLLYHFILGKFMWITNLGHENIVYLRIFSVIFSLLTVYFGYKTVKKITDNKLVWVLTVIILTNIPMFSFLSGFLNYDNLVNFLSSLSIYLLISFYEKRSLKLACFLLITIGLGAMTKVAFLPLGLICGLIFLVISILEIRNKRNSLKEELKQVNKGTSFLLIAITVIILSVPGMFFIRNISSYSDIQPSCNQVLGHEACLHNNAYERNYILNSDPNKDTTISWYDYFNIWYNRMLKRTTGILAHKSIIKDNNDIIVYKVLFLTSIVGLIRVVGKNTPKLNILLIISVFYILILAYYQNYNSYLFHGSTSVAVQGRYIFPVIVPISILMSYSLLELFKNKYLSPIIVIMVFLILSWGDYIYFKQNVTDNWYNQSSYGELSKRTNHYFKK